MNQSSFNDIVLTFIDAIRKESKELKEENKDLKKDLKTALLYLSGFGWSNEASREFYSGAMERWFRGEDG